MKIPVLTQLPFHWGEAGIEQVNRSLGKVTGMAVSVPEETNGGGSPWMGGPLRSGGPRRYD